MPPAGIEPATFSCFAVDTKLTLCQVELQGHKIELKNYIIKLTQQPFSYLGLLLPIALLQYPACSYRME